MGQGAARASRRAIRRAFGAEAIDVVDRQGQVLTVIQAQVPALETALRQKSDEQSRAFEHVWAAHDQHVAEFQRFQGMAFRQRLRWLFLGR